MADPFQYQTYRLAWYIEARSLVDAALINCYGPFPTMQSAHDHSIALSEELHLQPFVASSVFKTVSRFELVDIDPILSNAVQGIAGLVSEWFGRTDPTNPFAPRPSGYVKMANVEASMKQLSEVILKTFEINKENPDVSEDQIED